MGSQAGKCQKDNDHNVAFMERTVLFIFLGNTWRWHHFDWSTCVWCKIWQLLMSEIDNFVHFISNTINACIQKIQDATEIHWRHLWLMYVIRFSRGFDFGNQQLLVNLWGTIILGPCNLFLQVIPEKSQHFLFHAFVPEHCEMTIHLSYTRMCCKPQGE